MRLYITYLFSILAILATSTLTAQQGTCEFNTDPFYRNGSGILGLTYSNTVCGLDFVTTSQRTTTRYLNLAGSGFPVNMTVSGIPTGATIEQAYAWWGGSFLGGDPRIVVNSDTIVGQSIGTGIDKCWGQAGTENFRADVTAYISANGVYSINCLEGEYGVDGVTLMVIFSDPTANFSGTLIIEDGCIVQRANIALDTFDIVLPPICQPTNGKVFVLNSDMQIVGSNTHTLNINGNPTIFNNEFWNYSEATAYFTASQLNFPMSVTPATGDCYNWIATGSYFRNIGVNGCVTSIAQCPLVICQGDSVLLDAFAGPIGSTYLWSSPTETLLDSTSQSIYAKPIGSSAEYYCTTTLPDATTVDTSFIVIVNPQPELTATSSDESCSGLNNGIIDLVISGFSPNDVFVNGNPVTTPSLTNLSPNTYLISVVDFYGCNHDTTITILPGPPDFTDNLFLSDTIICNDTIIGIITPNPPAPYTYSWSPTITNTNPNDSLTYFTNLINGVNNISMSINHPNGCFHTYNFDLIFSSMEITSINASPDTVSVCMLDTLAIGSPFQYDVLSCGKATVPCIVTPVDVTVGSGSISSTLSSPFQSGKSDMRFQMLIHASEIAATGFDEGNIRGMYLTIPTLTSNQMLNGLNIKIDCTSLDTLNSFQNLSNLVYTGNYTPTSGSNYFDFLFDYAWDGVSNIIIEICYDNASFTSNNAILTNTTAYNSVVVDTSNSISGCTLNAGTVYTARPNVRFSTCRSLLHDFGNNYFDFNWTPSASVINPNDYLAFVHPVVDTWYYVTLSDVFGICTSTAIDSVFITVTPLTEGFFSYPIDTVCLYEGTYLLPDSITTIPGFFSSTLPSSIDSLTGLFIADTSLYGDLFYITYTPTAVCPDVDSFLIDVRGIVPSVNYASDNLCPDDPNAIPIYVYPTGGVFTSEAPGLVNGATGEINFSALTEGNYYPILYTLNEWRCTTDTTEILFLSNNCDPYTFNGITPNGDGFNDYWYIEGIDKGSNEVIIFNRWGDVVWSAKNYDNSSIRWSGNNLSGNTLPSGTYYFSIDFEGRHFGGYIELSY